MLPPTNVPGSSVIVAVGKHTALPPISSSAGVEIRACASSTKRLLTHAHSTTEEPGGGAPEAATLLPENGASVKFGEPFSARTDREAKATRPITTPVQPTSTPGELSVVLRLACAGALCRQSQ